MADTLIVPATGAVLATDDISGVHYPRTKIAHGADGAATDVSTASPLPVTLQGISASAPLTTVEVLGVGAMGAIPAATTNGTAIGTKPAGAVGVGLYFPAGTSISYTVATSAPASAPTAVMTIGATDTPRFDEPLAGTAQIYVTARTGAPLFRWF